MVDKKPQKLNEKEVNVFFKMFGMVQNYSEYSTIQGIVYIFQSGQSALGRIFWIMVVLVMLWLCGYMSWQVSTFKYLQWLYWSDYWLFSKGAMKSLAFFSYLSNWMIVSLFVWTLCCIFMLWTQYRFLWDHKNSDRSERYCIRHPDFIYMNNSVPLSKVVSTQSV